MSGERAAVSVGSNLGDRLAHLQAAVDALIRAPGVDVLAVSSVVETDPVGGPEQPDFLNAVVVVETSLAAEDLLTVTQSIEAAAMGRSPRPALAAPDGPRRHGRRRAWTFGKFSCCRT